MTQEGSDKTVTVVVSYADREQQIRIDVSEKTRSEMFAFAIVKAYPNLTEADPPKKFSGVNVDGLPFIIDLGPRCVAITTCKHDARSY